MARVEADAEARVPFEPVVDRRELLERAADRGAGPGGVLHQQPGRVGAALEAAPQRRDDPLEPRLEARAEMRADMEDDRLRVDPARDVDRLAESGDGLLVDRIVRRREVDQVERVADDRQAELGTTLAEAVEVLVRVRRRPPHARALREDLDRLAAELLVAVECRVDPARRRDVCADQHRVTLAFGVSAFEIS